ncbi:MAG: FAD-binding domain-containing protein [Chloroflexota bacterium]
MSQDMRRDFENRADLIEYLKDEFPKAYATDPAVSDEFIGGRAEAEKRLQQVKPGNAYKRTRNYLDGAVSRLSPYIRYGILSLAEVRDYALAEAGNGAGKFVNELGWRDYWQRLYAKMGDDIWQDQENYKTGFLPHEYADELPEDIAKGETGVALIDDIVNELRTTGYLHNRQRMYFAAYVVHWRNVKWQAGARFFLTHLLDGDPASNNLSWQWVSSTFSHKPYIFNLSNVRKFTGKKYEAPAHETGMEVFEGSYEQINKDLFRVKVT